MNVYLVFYLAYLIIHLIFHDISLIANILYAITLCCLYKTLSNFTFDCFYIFEYALQLAINFNQSGM